MKYEPEATLLNQARAAFKEIWGYNDFRPPQGEIVSSLLSGKDTLIIMPTGGGKSICFQLPALLQTGLTLVVIVGCVSYKIFAKNRSDFC